MKRIIRSIEKALGDLYNIDLNHHAEDFVVAPEKGSAKSALLVRPESEGVSLGIYFGSRTREDLPDSESSQTASNNKLASFSVVAEEISHFHYLLFHSSYGRPLTRLELEIQGNVDAFVVSFFAGRSEFDTLFERLFVKFSLGPGLEVSEKLRYLEANRIAGGFVKSLRGRLQTQKALDELRKYYRLGLAEKISKTQAA